MKSHQHSRQAEPQAETEPAKILKILMIDDSQMTCESLRVRRGGGALTPPGVSNL